jgi:molybdenum cofactor cytidylyltransferase
MKLFEAFQVTANDVVAFVGGGGKTSTMFRLAKELVAQGVGVISTTTTRIFAAQTRLAPFHVQSLAELILACQQQPHVLFTGEIDPIEGKAFGVDPTVIELVRNQIPNRAILIEADGSRMRPFKAPATHEPVIPTCATLVVPVVGIDALGLPLTSQYVHRPEQVAAIWPGETVTPEMVARILVDPMGGRKNVPAGARVVALINKVEDEAQEAAAAEIVRVVRHLGGIDAVVVGAIARPDKPLQRYSI